ncbi:hypothetical protein TNCV_3300091 [Trichonephila clavipes]|nr:hypothetical protein TNCV_3300091 [Trichonephila clavipes]
MKNSAPIPTSSEMRILTKRKRRYFAAHSNGEKSYKMDYIEKSLNRREAAYRAAETLKQSQARRRRHAEYLATKWAAETPEQSQARRLQQATYMASERGTETIEVA